MTLASLQEINSLNSLSPEERTQKERIIASHLLDILKEVKPESGADRKELNTTTAERLGTTVITVASVLYHMEAQGDVTIDDPNNRVFLSSTPETPTHYPSLVESVA